VPGAPEGRERAEEGRLPVVPVLALAFGLQALLRASELLAPGSALRSVALFVGFPLAGAVAVLVLAGLHGRRRALLAAAAVLVVGPGFRPATVDGRYTQSHKTLYGRQQEAVRWTTEAMVAKYGDVVTRGFDGAGVAESMKAEGVDLMVLYGPGYDMWVDGIDPDLQAGMARAYNRWAEEMRETSGGRVLAAE